MSAAHPIGRVPRNDLDAEAAVLSACLLSEEAALEAVELLAPAEFYADANRRVFEAITGLASSGSTIDVVAVAAELQARKRLEQVGGTAYLAQIADATPAIRHIAAHAKIVRDLARVRSLVSVLRAAMADAELGEIPSVDGLLESIESRVYAATAMRGEKKPVAGLYRQIALEVLKDVGAAANSGRKSLGFTTGLRFFDQHIGGMIGGDLLIIAARPGMGKTSLLVQICEGVASDAENPAASIIFSQEMKRHGLMMRSLAQRSELRSNDLRRGSVANWKALTDAAESVSRLPIIIDDEPGLTPMRMRAKVRRHLSTLRAEFPDVPLGVIAADYVQLMRDDREHGTRAEELGAISRDMKLLAQELNCTMVALSQVRRPAERGAKVKPPELADLRDSGALEADADSVIVIHRVDEYRQPGEEKNGLADICAIKGRSSGTGWCQMKFDGPSTKFSDLDLQENAEQAFGQFDDWRNK